MKEKLDNIYEQAKRELKAIKTMGELEKLKIKYLGRKNIISQILRNIKSLPQDSRPAIGRYTNQIKQNLQNIFLEKSNILTQLQQNMKEEEIDITLPGRKFPTGHIHPVTFIINQICDIFSDLGFQLVEGPEIETDYYNFTALNIPPEHPSRDIFDTFYLETSCGHDKGNLALLRSQTSTVQIRIMQKLKPPFKIIAPGKVFRPDNPDASHSFMFHQIEGLMVGKDVKFSHLKGTLEIFAKQIFGQEVNMRFRPSFFPFTEPSAEVDISCMLCRRNQKPETRNQKKNCSVCHGKGWLEILGAGMVDPEVFKQVNINPEEYTGFAFGMGVERIAMLKFGIDDIRLFFENDLRVLNQF